MGSGIREVRRDTDAGGRRNSSPASSRWKAARVAAFGDAGWALIVDVTRANLRLSLGGSLSSLYSDLPTVSDGVAMLCRTLCTGGLEPQRWK